MSTTPLDLPILIAQLPYVAKVAHVEKASPDMQKQLFNPLIHEQVQKDQSKVQEVDKKQKTSPVDRDGKQQQQAQSDSKRKSKEEKEEPETSSANPSPWSGNIINVKI